MSEQPCVACNECGAILAEPTDLDPALRQPCPGCGSLSRRVKVQFESSIEIHSLWAVVHKGVRPGVRGRRLVESKTGDSQSADGSWAHVEQVVDRIKRRYRKRVVSADGRVIRDLDEPLEDHQGRGSAKPRPRPRTSVQPGPDDR